MTEAELIEAMAIAGVGKHRWSILGDLPRRHLLKAERRRLRAIKAEGCKVMERPVQGGIFSSDVLKLQQAWDAAPPWPGAKS